MCHGAISLFENVVTLELTKEKCVGCGICIEVCPQGVIVMNSGTAHLVNRDDCMECGACASNCPSEAITVEAGVGCAAAVINSALGRKNDACCCIIEKKGASCC